MSGSRKAAAPPDSGSEDEGEGHARTRQRRQLRGDPQIDLFASPRESALPGRALPPAHVGHPLPFSEDLLGASPLSPAARADAARMLPEHEVGPPSSYTFLPTPSWAAVAQGDNPLRLADALLVPGSALQVRLRIGFDPCPATGEAEHLKALEAGALSEIIAHTPDPGDTIALVSHCVEVLEFEVNRAPFPLPQPLVAALTVPWTDLNEVVRRVCGAVHARPAVACAQLRPLTPTDRLASPRPVVFVPCSWTWSPFYCALAPRFIARTTRKEEPPRKSSTRKGSLQHALRTPSPSPACACGSACSAANRRAMAIRVVRVASRRDTSAQSHAHACPVHTDRRWWSSRWDHRHSHLGCGPKPLPLKWRVHVTQCWESGRQRVLTWGGEVRGIPLCSE